MLCMHYMLMHILMFSSESTWPPQLPVPTAPPDVWHVVQLEHMAASADVVLYMAGLM